jgi:hypothetical protein
MENDPGPFQSATPEKVAEFGPVFLVAFLESGDVNIMLSLRCLPLMRCRERLRPDQHAMKHLTSVPSLEEMTRMGHNFQFHTAKKDVVSESHAILRGVSNKTVGTKMDQVMPASHSCSAHFKLLGHHGECQEKWDAGNLTGGLGKGCQIDLGACNHNCKGENAKGMGPTPRTDGGVKCFSAVAGNEEINPHQEQLRDCFGAQMDAVQLTVDKVHCRHQGGTCTQRFQRGLDGKCMIESTPRLCLATAVFGPRWFLGIGDRHLDSPAPQAHQVRLQARHFPQDCPRLDPTPRGGFLSKSGKHQTLSSSPPATRTFLGSTNTSIHIRNSVLPRLNDCILVDNLLENAISDFC